jgi:hypothetical protein
LSWQLAHRMSQSPHGGDGGETVTQIRRSATITRGTRMVKILSGRQLAGFLRGWLPQGYCYREFDVAHLRTPADLAILRSDGEDGVRDPAEQRAWSRMSGPQWRWLYAGVPGVAPEQELFAVPPAPVRLIGAHRGREFEAVADPPDEFRVLAKTRAARYPVESLSRRTPYVTWRGAPCTMIRDEGDWLRLRLIRPSADVVAQVRANCVERGIYESWAPRGETSGLRNVDVRYDLGRTAAADPHSDIKD